MAQMDLTGHPLWQSQDPRNALRQRFYLGRSAWCGLALLALLAYLGTTYELVTGETAAYVQDRNYWQFWSTLGDSPRATAAFASMVACVFGTWALYRRPAPQRGRLLVMAGAVAVGIGLLRLIFGLWSSADIVRIGAGSRMLLVAGLVLVPLAWTLSAAAAGITIAYPKTTLPRLVGAAAMVLGWLGLGLTAMAVSGMPGGVAGAQAIDAGQPTAVTVVMALSGLLLLAATILLLINAALARGAAARALNGRRLLSSGVVLLLIGATLLGMQIISGFALELSAGDQFYWLFREGLWLLLACALLATGLSDWYKNRRFNDEQVMLCLAELPPEAGDPATEEP